MEQVLKQILESQNQIIKTLQQHGKLLEQHSTLLEKQGAILEQHSTALEKQGTILGQHSKQLETLQRGQIKLETRMENEVIDKIRVLFDVREVQNDRFDRIDNKLDDLDDKIEYALLKLMRQELKMQSKRKLL